MMTSNSKRRASTLVILAVLFITLTHQPSTCKAIPEEDTTLSEATSTLETTTQSEVSKEAPVADAKLESEASESEPSENETTDTSPENDSTVTEPSEVELLEISPPKNESEKRDPLKNEELEKEPQEKETKENESTDNTPPEISPMEKVRAGKASSGNASLEPVKPENTIEENSPSIQVLWEKETSSKTQKRAEPNKSENNADNVTEDDVPKTNQVRKKLKYVSSGYTASEAESDEEPSCCTSPDNRPKWRHKLGYPRRKISGQKCESQDSFLPENAKSSNKPTIYISKCHAPQCNQDHYHASHRPFSPTMHGCATQSRHEPPPEPLPSCSCSASTMAAPPNNEVSQETVPPMPQRRRPFSSTLAVQCGPPSQRPPTSRPQPASSASPDHRTADAGGRHHVHTCVVISEPHKKPHAQQCQAQQSRCPHTPCQSSPCHHGSPCHRPRCHPPSQCHTSPCRATPCQASSCRECSCHTPPSNGAQLPANQKKQQIHYNHQQQQPKGKLQQELQQAPPAPQQEQDAELQEQTNGLKRLGRRRLSGEDKR